MEASIVTQNTSEQQPDQRVFTWEELGDAVFTPDISSAMKSGTIMRPDNSLATFKEVFARPGKENEPEAILHRGVQLISQLDRLITPGGMNVVDPRLPRGDWEPETQEYVLPVEGSIAISGIAKAADRESTLNEILESFQSLGGIEAMQKSLGEETKYSVLLRRTDGTSKMSYVRLVGFSEEQHIDEQTGETFTVPALELMNSRKVRKPEPADAVVFGLYEKGEDRNVDHRELPNES